MQEPNYGEIVYRLDKHDRIFRVNESWNRFAGANGGSELRAPRILGRVVWDFIVGEEVIRLNQALLERVRSGHHLFDLPFRCDAPSVRRFMLMDLWPLPDRGVEYRCRVQYRQEREPIRLLDPKERREGKRLRMCSWCRRVDIGRNTWVEVEDAISLLDLFLREKPPPITHTLCPRDKHLLDHENG
ncbi:hypothetical protein [Thiohalomonas denitrificans]|uniref:PAS fold-containing protein n=1 Tax=Thiohalomonas denitrificans TaxID=415747 RepID=A0A1G5QYZ3_9GAMM|nr:hypothetical protein [Thiohalomonas denitrificans]SCZ67084.1 hypothetical protein SAMN03097708_03086 [Thiohalomonas denitrificans]